MKKPYNIKDLNLNNITFSRLLDKNSKRSVLLKYNKGNRLTKCLIQTPEVKILDLYNKGNIVTLVLSMLEVNDKINNFVQFWSLFDHHIINVAKNNGNWFYSNNVKFKGSIRNDGEYNEPYIKLKLNANLLNKIKVSYDKQTQLRSFSDLEKGQTIKLVLDLYGLWINNNGFGLYMKPVVIDIRETNEITLNESSDEDEDIFDTEINPISETSVLNLNTEVSEVNERLSSEMDSVTNLIELEIEDMQKKNIIIENSENESSSEDNINLNISDEKSSSDSFNNLNNNTSTECQDIINH